MLIAPLALSSYPLQNGEGSRDRSQQSHSPIPLADVGANLLRGLGQKAQRGREPRPQGRERRRWHLADAGPPHLVGRLDEAGSNHGDVAGALVDRKVLPRQAKNSSQGEGLSSSLGMYVFIEWTDWHYWGNSQLFSLRTYVLTHAGDVFVLTR